MRSVFQVPGRSGPVWYPDGARQPLRLWVSCSNAQAEIRACRSGVSGLNSAFERVISRPQRRAHVAEVTTRRSRESRRLRSSSLGSQPSSIAWNCFRRRRGRRAVPALAYKN